MTLGVRVISDIHIEYYYKKGKKAIKDGLTTLNPVSYACDKITSMIKDAQRNTDTSSDVLVILGDVCPIGFINRQGERLWDYMMLQLLQYYEPYKVIFVPGNHEYYHCHCSSTHSHKNYLCKNDDSKLKHMNKCDQHMVNFCQTHKIIYLNYGESHFIGDVGFVGATGWTDNATEGMNDYHKIDYSDQNVDACSKEHFSVEYAKMLHSIQMENMAKSIERLKQTGKIRKIVALTHHAPMKELCEYKKKAQKHKHKDITGSYCSTDVNHLVNQVDYWLYGHTHDFFYTSTHGKTVLMTNARGREDYDTQSAGKRLSFEIGINNVLKI